MTHAVAESERTQPWWWATVAMLAAALGGLVVALPQVPVPVPDHRDTTHFLPALLLGHGLSCAFALGISAVLRMVRGRDWPRSRSYWPGIGWGSLVAIATPIATGAAIATPAHEFVEAIGVAFFMSAVTFELVGMCLIGGLAWLILVNASERRSG